MKTKSTLYATDRDIFEALMSKQKKFNKDLLLELIRDRGILVSSEESREKLIDYLSFLPHDYNDFNYLADLLTVNSRQEKLTSTQIDTEITKKDITNIVRDLSDDRNPLGETYEVTVESNTKTVIKVDYTEMDLAKTRLRQKQEKVAYIEIIKETDGKTKIRRPANDKFSAIIDDLIINIEKIKEEKYENQEISLKGIEDSEKRTKFFTNMIKGIQDVRLTDVSIIKVDRINNQGTEEFEDLDEDTEEIAQRFLGQVKKVALNGEGLLYSEEYQHLLKQGFYIYSIVWQAEEVTNDGNRIEFEALFANSGDCTDFRYNIKGIYRRRNEDSFTIGKRPADEGERTKYLSHIEAAAQKSLLDIIDA